MGERTGQRGGDHAFAGSHGRGWYDLGAPRAHVWHATHPGHGRGTVCCLPRPDRAEGRAFWRQAPNIIFAQVYFPTYSNGLKDNAGFIGAHWQCPDPDGLHTIIWRSEWERTRVSSLKDQLIAYNRDDCVALGLLAEELGKLGIQSKSRADVDFAQTPKQTGTERSAEIHRTFEGLLRSAHSNYSEKRMRFRAIRTQTGTDSKKQTTRRVRKKRKLSTSKGRLVRVPRKRICPKHPTQELMPSREIAEHALLDIAFTRNGCRKVVVRYVGKKAYCPLCDETYPPSVVKRLQNQVYGQDIPIGVTN